MAVRHTFAHAHKKNKKSIRMTVCVHTISRTHTHTHTLTQGHRLCFVLIIAAGNHPLCHEEAGSVLKAYDATKNKKSIFCITDFPTGAEADKGPQ